MNAFDSSFAMILVPGAVVAGVYLSQGAPIEIADQTSATVAEKSTVKFAAAELKAMQEAAALAIVGSSSVLGYVVYRVSGYWSYGLVAAGGSSLLSMFNESALRIMLSPLALWDKMSSKQSNEMANKTHMQPDDA